MKLLGLFCLQISVILVAGRQVTFERSRSKGRRNKDKSDDVSSHDNVRKDREEKWVADFINYDEYQADAPGYESSFDSCPPVPDVTSSDACADSCQSDTDCSESYRCCYNGCAFTCLREVEPAPVVDWIIEPRRSRSGFSWLIPGPSTIQNKAEPCSTDPVGKDEDPLLCPHGYFCHVDTENKGKKKKKKQTEGYCVKQTDEQYSPGEVDMAVSAALAEKQFCSVEGMVLLEGASVTFEDKHCRCKQGSLSCRERHKKNLNVQKKEGAKSKKRRNRRRKSKDGGQQNSS